MKTDFQLALLCASAVSLTVIGCDGGDGDTGAGDGTMATTGDAGDGSDPTVGDNTTMADAGGTATDTAGNDDSTTEDPDPTEGEEPPTWPCPAQPTVYDGHIVLGDFQVASETPITDLEGISIIDGDLLIGGRNYVNLDFLQCITEVRGDIQIYDMPFLTDVSGTDNLVKVGRPPGPCPSCPGDMDDGRGNITISNNPMLTDIDGFAGLTDVGEGMKMGGTALAPMSLVIRSNPALVTVSGFDNLLFIWSNLIIQENDALQDIKGLGGEACGADAPNIGLGAILGAFGVSRNPNLCLSSVNCVGGNLQYLGGAATTNDNNDGC